MPVSDPVLVVMGLLTVALSSPACIATYRSAMPLFSRLGRSLSWMTSTVTALGGTDVTLSADGLNEKVPLLGGLCHKVTIKLVVQAQTVTFLPTM